MILTGKEDLRVQKTVSAIRETFEKLLCEKDYEKITVTELATRARINKKTFYAYYNDLDDVLAEMQEELSQKYIERTKGLRRLEDAAQITREFFVFSAEQGLAYEKITCGGSYTLNHIRGQMMKKVASEAVPNADEKEQMILAFMRAATLEMYKFWIDGGKRIPLEEIINMTISLICKGIDGTI